MFVCNLIVNGKVHVLTGLRIHETEAQRWLATPTSSARCSLRLLLTPLGKIFFFLVIPILLFFPMLTIVTLEGLNETGLLTRMRTLTFVAECIGILLLPLVLVWIPCAHMWASHA